MSLSKNTPKMCKNQAYLDDTLHIYNAFEVYIIPK